MSTQTFPRYPTFFFPLFMPMAIKKKSTQQGIGRHSPEQVYKICEKACHTLSLILGNYIILDHSLLIFHYLVTASKYGVENSVSYRIYVVYKTSLDEYKLIMSFL